MERTEEVTSRLSLTKFSKRLTLLALTLQLLLVTLMLDAHGATALQLSQDAGLLMTLLNFQRLFTTATRKLKRNLSLSSKDSSEK